MNASLRLKERSGAVSSTDFRVICKGRPLNVSLACASPHGAAPIWSAYAGKFMAAFSRGMGSGLGLFELYSNNVARGVLALGLEFAIIARGFLALLFG